MFLNVYVSLSVMRHLKKKGVGLHHLSVSSLLKVCGLEQALEM